MVSLPNDCRRSEFIVIPKNWNINIEIDVPKKDRETVISEILDQEWRIVYRFYDPAYKGTKLWGKQIPEKGMNAYKTLSERRDYTQSLLNELEEVLKEGYNPITKKIVRPQNICEIDSNTPFPIALELAYKDLKCAEGTKDDIRKALVHIQDAVSQLNFDKIPVEKVKIRNCIMILKKVRETKLKNRDKELLLLNADYKARIISKEKFVKKQKQLQKYNFGASSFNHYRSYLIMLFKIIVPLANMSGNPVDNIPKEKEIKRIKEVLTPKQRAAINEYLYLNHYSFWRFLHIFFHSGARESEMMRVKPTDVDLDNQGFKALVLKGTSYSEEPKVIHKLVLPLWHEIMEEAKQVKSNGQQVYLFCRYLQPGIKPINEKNISILWKRFVKDNPKLGNITADFYCLKYMKTTEIRKLLGAKTAAINNSHKSEAMVVNIYDVEREQRKLEALEELKEVGSAF